MTYSFTAAEKKRIFGLVGRIVGTLKVADYLAEIFLNNVERRIYLTNSENLEDYLRFVRQNPVEHGYLFSALKIHMTYWFRENAHFSFIEKYFSEEITPKKIQVPSVGCSTGEEVYSLAIILEGLRKSIPGFDYEAICMDIDPVSVGKSRKAIYDAKDISIIVHRFRNDVLLESGLTSGKMTLSKSISSRVQFIEANAREITDFGHRFDIVISRNMLIYFDEVGVNRIFTKISRKVVPKGVIILSNSENFSAKVHLDKKAALFSLIIWIYRAQRRKKRRRL